MTFDDLWPKLPIPGEFDTMDACDQLRWREVIRQTFESAVTDERERWTTLLTAKWHSGEGKGITLGQYLGMSAAEYADWVVAPDGGIVPL